MMRFLFSALMLTTIVSLPLCVQAQRQPNRQNWKPGAAPPNSETLRVEGEIKGVQNGVLLMETADGVQWMVAPPGRGGKVEVKAPATVQFLKRGMTVHFTADFNAQGKAVSEVGRITVFTPTADKRPGVYPLDGGGASPALKAIFNDSDKPVQPVQPQSKRFAVAGVVRSITPGAIMVAAGRTAVSAPLGAGSTVAVELQDLRYARTGDKVRVNGWHLPAQPGRAYAKSIDVTSTQTLGAATTPGATPRTPTRGSAKRGSATRGATPAVPPQND